MSIIDKYLVQTAYLHKESEPDKYGEVKYTLIPIKCRMEMSQGYLGEITKTLMITEYQAKALMYTKDFIKLGQKITYNDNEYTAIQVNEIVNLDGTVSHYEVVLS